jgi:hypothetical protein
MFYYPLQIRPHPDGRHCGDCAKMVIYDGCHCAVSEFFEDPKQDDLEYEDSFNAFRCTGCLEAERKWRERGQILVQCSLCKGEWDDGPVLVPCPDCSRPGRVQAGQACTLCGHDGYPPGWVLLR